MCTSKTEVFSLIIRTDAPWVFKADSIYFEVYKFICKFKYKYTEI